MSLLAQLYRGGWLRTIDHALAESLRHARADTPDLVLAAAALASRAIGQGHSCLPLAQVPELLLDIASDRDPPALPAPEDWLDLLRASPWVAASAIADTVTDSDGSVLVLERETLALRRYWNYETRLAQALRARMIATDADIAGHDTSLEARLAQLFPDAGDAAQAAAARAALGQRLLLLTGGPGTGKTSTVARILVLFAERSLARQADGTGAAAHPPRVFLAAPTGKAAARLAESVRENLSRLLAEGQVDASLAAALPSQAQTLHRLLGWQSGSVQFKHNADHPLPAELVVIDEASMIDLPLMCKLLEAVAPQATLILIGDRDQLPSVETGDVLAALCDATTATASPALARQRIHLTHTHRQADDIDVAALAEAIRDGQAEAAIAGLAGDRFRGVHWHAASDRRLAEAVLAQALPAYRAVQSAGSVAAALAAARTFRVLTAVRDGAAGSQTLNATIARALDPARRGGGFFPGRLVLVTENSYRHNLFNGDIGIVWPDEQHELRVWFDGDGGPRSWLTAALPAHESAFALTVHKSQGSEFDRVFLALPERGARVISRELLYTGLTRCRRGVTLWASEPTLREGIARKAQRWSGLGARLA